MEWDEMRWVEGTKIDMVSGHNNIVFNRSKQLFIQFYAGIKL